MRVPRFRSFAVVGALSGLMLFSLPPIATGAAAPAPPPVPLQVNMGAAASFAVLGGEAVTNTGESVISGSVGVSTGTSIEGFPPGEVNNGSIYRNSSEAIAAKAALLTAYDDAAGRPSDADVLALDGQTLTRGVYTASTPEGDLLLNGGS